MKQVISKIKEKGKITYRSIKKRIKKNYLEHLEFYLTEHCNLNCAGCLHYSPIADEEFLSIESFEKDLNHMANVLNLRIKQIVLMGGEPLLHPKLAEFCSTARKYYPKSEIRIITNGLLIKKVNKDVWKNCKENNVNVEITEYPVKFNYEDAVNYLKEFGLKIYFAADSNKKEKKFKKWKIDEKPSQDASENFYKLCIASVKCAAFTNGKIYPCGTAAVIRHYNKFFKKNIPESPKNYIDIYKINSACEIYEFMTKPISLCANCDRKSLQDGIKWKVSKKEYTEWN